MDLVQIFSLNMNCVVYQSGKETPISMLGLGLPNWTVISSIYKRSNMNGFRKNIIKSDIGSEQ